MKIAICARSWDEKGGIGVYTRTLVPRLLEIDQSNEYLLLYSNARHLGQFSHHRHVSEMHVPLRSKLLGNEFATLIWDQIDTPRFAKRHGADLILHTKLSIPLFTKRKTVMVLHGTERFFYPEAQNFSDIVFFRTIYPWYLRRATLVLSDCENSRRDVIRELKLNPEKIVTVHLAGDPAFHVMSDQKALAQVRTKYKLPKRFLIFVGHIYPGKNVGRLFRALVEIRRHHDVDLVVAGSPRRKYRKDFELIEQLGLKDHVHMAGYVPLEDLVAMYNLAEATVFPSIYECFPAIPLDSNACGCPVVTSHTGGTPEAAGNAAAYVDPKSVNEIADAVCKVLSDRAFRADLVAKGFENARRFSWEKTARATLVALQSLE